MAGSIQECATVAKAAGFSGESLTTIVAIAGGESGWRSDAIAVDDGGPGYPSVGYFQINTNAHFDKIPGAGLSEKINNLINNPGLQGSLAWQISGGGSNFAPWTVYKTGAYRNHLPAAQEASSNSVAPNADNQASKIVQFALAQVGKPYVWGGGRGTDANFDCSGLTQAAYQTIGIEVGGDAWIQSTNGTDVKAPFSANAAPGDLLFFNGDFPWNGGGAYRDGPEHVAIYIGGGEQVDARGTSYGVVKRTVPWEQVVGVRRFISSSGVDPMSLKIGIPGVDTFIPDEITDAFKFVGKAGLWMTNPANWIRIFAGTIGSIAMLLGVALMAKNTSTGQAALSTVQTVAGAVPHPAGQIVSQAAKVAK